MQTPIFMIKRLFSTKLQTKPKLCIVGAGPAGFYAAQHLVKKLETPEIDIFERLPVPFGLVRFGVAPDHPEVKNVINTFTKTAQNPHIRFYGNIHLGKDITLDQLKTAYHVVLLTYGAEKSRKLNIPGESLKNCLEARKIVGWYNGIPWDTDLEIDLSGETVAIFGQGNVAIDVARILLTPVDELKKTDITQHALDCISSSKVKRVYLVGRRGPLQAAFTIKELREMLKLKKCQTFWQQNDFVGIADILPKLARPRKRLTELMLKSVAEQPKETFLTEFRPVFQRSPLKILGDNRVEEVILGVNSLEGEDYLNKIAIPTEVQESLKCELVVTSIGYKSIKVDPSIPFDPNRGVVQHQHFKVEEGVYVSGWLATGPTGVILTTMSNAFEVADCILKDIYSGSVLNENKEGYRMVERELKKNNVQIVDWGGWEKIDKYEQDQGSKLGKPREKITDIKRMLDIALS